MKLRSGEISHEVNRIFFENGYYNGIGEFKEELIDKIISLDKDTFTLSDIISLIKKTRPHINLK